MSIKTKIAIARPFEGKPQINIPSIIGASSKKPILIRIATTGERPIEYEAIDLPNGVYLEDNILQGTVENDGEYQITLIAKNALGMDEKKFVLEIKEQNVLVTPLLGYTSWNAFAQHVTQNDIEGIAEKLVELGISEYGYSYVNTDSGWQGEYGGEYDAVMPNAKFPDMKKMTDKIHALGLKCGIYSTPMLTAWGCPDELESIPGCTQGEPDHRFALTNGGIGVIHKERNNAIQWNEWGFDYLKYDWAPTDPINADLMRTELTQLDRDFGFCVTVRAIKEYSNYWSKYCNSYRSNPDTLSNWDNLVEIYETYFDFVDYICKGHYFDLDMLDFGTCRLHTMWNCLTDDEKIMEFSMRAFLNSPIQISSTLENITDFELSVYCNDEILAINQDGAFNTSKLISRVKEENRYFDILEKELEDGAFAYAFFNLGKISENLTVSLDENGEVRDLWAKENIKHQGNLLFEIPPHTAKIIKSITKISFE